MIKKVKNECVVSGKLYGFGRFGLSKDDNGKIRGSVVVATDPAGLNLVEVNFIPQAKVYSTGRENNNYKVLEKIIESNKTVEEVGMNNAYSVRISCSLTTNPFYTMQGDEAVLVEPFQIKGNFIHIDDKAKGNCGFNIDCLFKGIQQEVNTEGVETDSAVVRVDVFDDYRNYFFPLTLKIDQPDGIAFMQTNYLEGESYTTLSGTIINKSVEVPANNSNMGFGESASVSSPKKIREILITGAEIARELPMTDEDMESAQQNRNTYLAELKNRALERNSKTQTVNNTFGAATSTNTAVNVAKTSKKYEF